jgi:hypothetical protein
MRLRKKKEGLFMTTIKLTIKDVDFKSMLSQLADDLELSFEPYEDGYRFMPEEIYAIDGIQVTNNGDEWSFWREVEATSIEDFLLMHITHRLASELGLLLYYEWTTSGKFVEPTPEHFQSFEDYADYVTRNDVGVIKDTKKTWLFNHMKKVVR